MPKKPLWFKAPVKTTKEIFGHAVVGLTLGAEKVEAHFRSCLH